MTHFVLLQANVSLLSVDGVCAETAPGTWSSIRQFDIPPSDTVTVKFNIIPLEIGEFPIQIKVVTPNGKDIVRDVLKVVVSISLSKTICLLRVMVRWN